MASKRRFAPNISPKSMATLIGITPLAVTSYNLLHSMATRAFFRYKFWSAATPTPLAHFIFNIILISPKKKMIRVYANRIVALMQNMERFIKFPVFKLVTDPMRRSIFAFQPELSILLSFPASSFAEPSPTFIGSFFVYFSPEAFNIRGVHRHSILYARGVFK